MEERNIIKVNNKDKYIEYEELILKKQEVMKKAFQTNQKYIYTYGDLINELYRKQIEVIKLKKIINYCILQQNMGLTIFKDELDIHIEQEMKKHYEVLKLLINEKNQIDQDFARGGLSEETLKLIKKVYYSIAKMIHPDLHPELVNNEDIMEFWQSACLYYECNDLKALEEIFEGLKLYFDDEKNYSEVFIEDIADKIIKLNEEIYNIMNTVPYTYLEFLTDSVVIYERRNQMKEEISSFDDYIEVLKEKINEFNMEEKMV